MEMNNKRWHEADRQEFLDEIVKLLRMTSGAGHPENNPLKEIKIVTKEYGMEFARPIFEDGTGENGYYDVCIDGDNNMGVLYDVFNKFVKHMW